MAQQQSGTSSTEAQNEQHQYDLVVERTNKLLGGAKDSDGDVINAADHISSACGLVGGNCEFKIKNGDADSDFRSALNKSLGEADGDTGAHGGLSAPTHRVGFSTSLHHDNDALHVDHYNGAKFPLGTLLLDGSPVESPASLRIVEELIETKGRHPSLDMSGKFVGRSIVLLDMRTGTALLTVKVPMDSLTYAYALSRDGKKFAVLLNSKLTVYQVP